MLCKCTNQRIEGTDNKTWACDHLDYNQIK